MLRSMTGFGRGTARAGTAEATVEVRTVNGRYAEVTVRGLGDLAEHETEVQNAIKAAIDRGNATVHVALDAGGATAGLRVDADAARAYGALLRETAEAAGLGAEAVTLADILRSPDVLVQAPAGDDDGTAWATVKAAVADALRALDTMRQSEGAALHSDLVARCAIIEDHVAEVDARAPERLVEARTRLHDRLADLIADDRLDASRLEAEVALLADKLDVTEETVRLRSHLTQFRQALDSGEPVGRRLNFLAQEIGREINTIGSKASDAEITRLAVGMKDELEKIREQVQNVV